MNKCMACSSMRRYLWRTEKECLTKPTAEIKCDHKRFLEESEQSFEGQVGMVRRYLNQRNGKRCEEQRVRENTAYISKNCLSGMTAVP